MEKVVVDRVAARVHDLRRVQQLVYCGSVPDHCRHALEALKPAGIECPRPTPEFIEKMTGWYIDFLNANA